MRPIRNVFATACVLLGIVLFGLVYADAQVSEFCFGFLLGSQVCSGIASFALDGMMWLQTERAPVR